MLLRLDFSLDTPIYLQIRNQIVRGIAAGELVPGQLLPTVRALAEDCGVNMMTVSKAYSQLKQEGYIRTDRRAGTVVLEREDRELPEPIRENLLLALSEAKAAGTNRETVLDLVKEVFG
jgi:DNA-binding transcriptional regulator YhcF (GntR family)